MQERQLKNLVIMGVGLLSALISGGVYYYFTSESDQGKPESPTPAVIEPATQPSQDHPASTRDKTAGRKGKYVSSFCPRSTLMIR